MSFFNQEVLSTEMIMVQQKDKSVEEVTKLFESIVEKSKRFDISSGYDFFKNKEIYKDIKNIDKVITKRFGINFHHSNLENIGYGMFSAPPSNYNVLYENIEDVYKWLGGALGKDNRGLDEITEKDVGGKETIKDRVRDGKSFTYWWWRSIRSIDNTLVNGKIKIDLEKATMKGLGDDYNIFLVCDLHLLIKGLYLTPRQLTAVLYHEIGHAFTHIENVYRTVKTTTNVIDSIKDVVDKGGDTRKAIEISYKKDMDGDKDLSTMSSSKAIIEVMDKYMTKTNTINKNNTLQASDSEQLADQFASQFGLSTELSFALDKFNNFTILPNIRYKSGVASILLLYGLMLFIFLFDVFILVTITMVLQYIFTFVFTIIYRLVDNDGSRSAETTYDNNKDRQQRLRNNLVRVLRKSDLPKEEIKKIILDINAMDKLIKKTSVNDTVGLLIDKLPWNRKKVDFTKMEQLIESLSENNLHVATAKLKTL